MIVGGGIVGASVAYHLAALAGWRDTVLIEQQKIAGGTTWHAAGMVGRLRTSNNMTRINKYSADLYASLEKGRDIDYLLEPFRIQVAADGPSKGPASAPVTVIEFSDFQCPYCKQVVPTIEQAIAKYGDKIRVVFRQYPLTSIHPQAFKAAEASLCAAEQGKFWELHDRMFANQQKLGVDDLKKHAADLKLDTAKFNKCLDSGEKASVVQADLADGKKVGVTGTPAFFINGILLSGAQPFEEFKSIIDEELKTAQK